MENIIIGLIGITIGFCTGHILGSRREAEKHRLYRLKNPETEHFQINMNEKGRMTSVIVPGSYVEKFNMDIKSKDVKLPDGFGEMEPVMSHESFGFVPAAAPVKRKRKPRTAAQKKVARDKMREYRARKRKAQK